MREREGERGEKQGEPRERVRRGGRRGEEGSRKRRRRSIHRSASSPGVGCSPSSLLPSRRSPLRPLARSLSLLLLLFFITIFAFPTFCFMLMAAPCRYPLRRQPLFPSPRSQTSFHPRRPSLRMHGLGELLAFCLEFKKFFRLPSYRLVSPRPVHPSPSPNPRHDSSRNSRHRYVSLPFRFAHAYTRPSLDSIP